MENGATGADDSKSACAECGTTLGAGQDREVTPDGTFCRPCFNNLTEQVRQVVESQGRDVPYPQAILGGVLGGAVGVGAWWGFTVLTDIAFGLVAVVIGFAVGKGVVLFSGGKRSTGLQVASVIIAVLSFVYASYLVTRSGIHAAWAAEGQDGVLPLLPGPGLLFGVLEAGFHPMDLAFLAIVVYQAWVMPKPVALQVG